MEISFENDLKNYLSSESQRLGYSFEEINDDSNLGILFPDLKTVILFHRIGSEYSLTLHYDRHDLSRVIHIWEDQWYYHQEKVKSRINSLFGNTRRIHGRETKIFQLDNPRLINFLKVNHLNVPLKGKFKYGLLKGTELVAAMAFSKSRPMLRAGQIYNSFELLRFCNKLNTTVVGGVGKLLNHFIKRHNPDDIMTYIDADWSDGHSLKSLGFKYVERKPEVEFWLNTKTGEREYPLVVLADHKISIDDDEFDKQSFLEENCYKIVKNSGSYKYLLDRKLLTS